MKLLLLLLLWMARPSSKREGSGVVPSSLSRWSNKSKVCTEEWVANRNQVTDQFAHERPSPLKYNKTVVGSIVWAFRTIEFCSVSLCFAHSKSHGVGRWALAATRSIAYAASFPFPPHWESRVLRNEYSIPRTIVCLCCKDFPIWKPYAFSGTLVDPV